MKTNKNLISQPIRGQRNNCSICCVPELALHIWASTMDKVGNNLMLIFFKLLSGPRWWAPKCRGPWCTAPLAPPVWPPLTWPGRLYHTAAFATRRRSVSCSVANGSFVRAHVGAVLRSCARMSAMNSTADDVATMPGVIRL